VASEAVSRLGPVATARRFLSLAARRAGVVAIVASLVPAGAGCRTGGSPVPSTPTKPTEAHSGAATQALSADGGAREAADAMSAAADGLPVLTVVLDDQRLSAVRDRIAAHDDVGAAQEMSQALAVASLSPEESCAWSYVAGRLRAAANDATGAAAAFALAAGPEDGGPPCPLAGYAHLRRAQALVRAGRYDEAIPEARAVGSDVAEQDEAGLTLAEASAAKHDMAAAVPIWRDWLSTGGKKNRRGHSGSARWVDVALRLAAALMDGAGGPARDTAPEALDLCTTVLVEAPGSADKTSVLDLRARAAQLGNRPGVPPLGPDERARQAQAWLDAAQPKRAHETAEALLKAFPGPTSTTSAEGKARHEALCRAATTLAQATPRGKSGATADAWGVAIQRCEGEDGLVTALYQGARASASSQRSAEALARYEQVERLFPRHRLADDARFRAALVVADGGDAARSEAMLLSLADAYPDGDMQGEALFRVALARIGTHDLAGASAMLERAAAKLHDDRAQGGGGRAAYFRARVSDLSGDFSDAKDRYAAIVTDEPLSYYMLLAYARLRALDEGRARAARESAEAREPPGPFLTGEHADLESTWFERFRRLLEVGEIEAARREVSAAGVTAEGADAEVLWTLAYLYDRAGAPETGHAFARWRLTDYRGHWPTGRWRLAWDAAFPRVWQPIVARESEAAHVGPQLVWGIMREESAFIVDAKSAANALGLMQLMASTARLAAKGTPLVVDDDALKTPEVSIALGARVLGSLRGTFPVHPALAIAAYNAGTSAVRRWVAERGIDELDLFVERIPFDETRAYVKRVLASEAAYAYLAFPEALDDLLTLPPGPTRPARRVPETPPDR
jgi:soluble lytic murein transglycosylase